jgi:hypothetical protein
MRALDVRFVNSVIHATIQTKSGDLGLVASKVAKLAYPYRMAPHPVADWMRPLSSKQC